MATDSFDTSPSGTEFSIRTAFDLLSNDRRRLVAHVLSNRSDSLTLDELATAIADREETASPGRLADLRVELHHCHLPKFADAGLVRYDRDANRLTPLAGLSQLVSAFDLENLDVATPEC